ncbi:MAG: nucleotide pyrophosphohydrolase [Patescibacteria group bacterium]|jgi:NTP pyrophosphatase (non-canonical NTP hydrolase)
MNKLVYWQEEVDKWAGQFKTPYWQPLEILARLSEENGELAREINHRFGPKKKKPSEDIGEVSDEIGDMIFTLICLANSLKIDLDESMTGVMNKCWGRDNDRYERKKV